MRPAIIQLFCIVISVTGQNLSQDKVGALGAGYSYPTPISAAPGQLLTLMAYDAGNGAICSTSAFSPPECWVTAPGGADLPTTLAGVSLTYATAGTHPPPIPILQVNGFSTSGVGWMSGLAMAAITVQIPFEAPACAPQMPSCPNPTPGVLMVLTAAGSALASDIYTFPDQIHILTSCDTVVQGGPYSLGSFTGLPCSSISTHADGSPISAQSPAQPGEVVVTYAVGLGQTNPPLATGKLVTTAAPTVTTFGLDFNFRPNALATKPLPSAPAPIYAGATPGYVGLYQVNFSVPPVPQGTPPCVDPSKVPNGTNVVLSNLTVSVGGVSSFDGARICVSVPGSQ